MAQLDIYLQWLGIRDPQRPVNHYRLLGIELFEQERDVIAAAADRQMSHVRSYQSGQYAEESQRLLNELMAARICLLTPARKQQYDQQLRAQLTPKPALAQPIPIVQSATIRQTLRAVTPRKSLTPWIALGAAVLVCISLVFVLRAKYAEQEQTPETALNKTAGNSADVKANLAKQRPRQNPPAINQELTANTTVAPPTLPAKPKSEETNKATVETVPKSTTNEKKKPPSKPKPDVAAPPSIPILGQLPDEATPDSNKQPEGTSDLTAKPESTETVLAANQPDPKKPAEPEVAIAEKPTPKIPDKAAITAKQKEIRDIFKDEYASRKIEDHLALAKKLFDSAIQQKDDPLTTYVLLTEARDQAVQFGEVTIAIQSCQELGKTNSENMFDDQVTALLKLQSLTGRPLAHYQAVLKQSLQVIDTLQAADEYDLALKLVNVSIPVSKKLNDAASFGQLNSRSKELTLLKASFAKVRAARETLKTNPLDADANQVWGEFLCFVKNDFDTGLPYLAKSSENELKAVAQQELSKPTGTEQLLTVADGWWSLSEKEKDRIRASMRGRAVLHYRKVQGQLNGLMAAKVDKRIKEAEADGIDTGGIAQITALLLKSNRMHFKFDFPVTVEDSSLEFKPDGKVMHHAFGSWQIVNGEVIVKSKADYVQGLIMRMKYQQDHFLVEQYDDKGKLLYRGIAFPFRQP